MFCGACGVSSGVERRNKVQDTYVFDAQPVLAVDLKPLNPDALRSTTGATDSDFQPWGRAAGIGAQCNWLLLNEDQLFEARVSHSHSFREQSYLIYFTQRLLAGIKGLVRLVGSC